MTKISKVTTKSETQHNVLRRWVTFAAPSSRTSLRSPGARRSGKHPSFKIIEIDVGWVEATRPNTTEFGMMMVREEKLRDRVKVTGILGVLNEAAPHNLIDFSDAIAPLKKTHFLLLKN
ncbi:MAG: hypothetical protein F6K47_38075 [Symploca sp. SIO2E6]|nr:hypothetical protein [Symploca sp. SIO2E6]